MQRSLIFALVSFIALMSVVHASPMPTAAPRIGRRQDSGAQTTAPYTTSYDPSQGIRGNGCQQGSDGNTLTCCPDGYQNQNINGDQRCVKLGGSSGSGSDSDSGNSAPVGTGNDQDNGDDDDDGQTLTGIETGLATFTSDGVIIVSHGISVQGSSSTSASLSSSATLSSTSAASSSNKSGSNGGSTVHVPVSLVLAVVGAVAIGAF